LRAFLLENKIKMPAEEFDSEGLRFDHRFSPFAHFQTPPLCAYHVYKERDEHFIRSVNAQKLFQLAQEHFDTARAIFDKHSECQEVKMKPYYLNSYLID